jgi:hypothetical protein
MHSIGVVSPQSRQFAQALPLRSGAALSDYTLVYDCPGYVGADEASGFPILHVGEGSVTVRRTILLTPLGGIEGLVLDEEGRPFPGVMVHVRRDGSTAAQQGVTDRDGRFRIARLKPANYRITARVAYADRKATLKRDPETGETFGYPDFTYYPSGWDAGAGALVQVPAGIPLRGFEVRLRRTRLVEFTGNVVARAGGEAIAGAEVELNAPGPDNPDETYRRRKVGADGGFAFDLLTPGHYDLNVFQGGSADTLPYATPVDIGKAGVTGMRVLAPPPQKLTGTIKVLPADPGAPVLVTVRFLSPNHDRSFNLYGQGEFKLEGIPPGRWPLGVEMHVSSRSSDGRKLAVASLRLGTEDALGWMTVSESGNPPLVLTLTAETGRIAGRLDKDDAGLNLTVAVHRVGLRTMQTAPVKADGSFAVEGLAPGAYDLAAVEAGRTGPSTTIRVEVKAGETSPVTLPLAAQ